MRRFLLTLIAMLALLAGATQFYDKLSPGVRQFMVEHELMKTMSGKLAKDYRPTFVTPRIIDGIEMIDAFIDFNDPSVIDRLSAVGVKVDAVFDDFAAAQIPVNLLEQITNIPGVLNIEIGKWLELSTDSTLKVTNAGRVIQGERFGLEQGYDGTGVVIGMIDAGYDYQHLAFRDASDTSRNRIVRVYDLLDSTAHPVIINNVTYPGRVFMGDQIDTLKTDGTATHGTHTTSIAAGSHVNGYGGMAPGADIVLCVCRNMESLVSEIDVARCIRYIFAYADSVGKPCVINLSVSTLDGAHDGNDRISRAVVQRSGPGRIFVISAGNGGNLAHYCSGPATMNKPFSFLLGYDLPGVDDDKSYCYRTLINDIWVRGVNQRPVIAFHVFDKEEKRIVYESEKITLFGRVDYTEFSDYFEPDTAIGPDGYCLSMISQDPLRGKFQANCNVYNLKSKSFTVDSVGKITSRYQLGASIYPPRAAYPNLTDSIYVDMWICKGDNITPPKVINFDELTADGDTITHEVEDYYSTPNNKATICNFAVNDSVISVGAFNARNSFYSMTTQVETTSGALIGAPCSFTAFQADGFGPTGKALPTVCAPGYIVVAAANRYSFFGNYEKNTTTIMRTDDGSVWGVMSGTSMAAPTVAGIIAQWLQAKPTLSVAEIKDVIAHTAIKDDFMESSYYGPRLGPNGKIDAMAGLCYILGIDPIELIDGDVDGDGFVNVSDVTALIQCILNSDFTGVIPGICDINHDGQVNVTDLTKLIEMILSKE